VIIEAMGTSVGYGVGIMSSCLEKKDNVFVHVDEGSEASCILLQNSIIVWSRLFYPWKMVLGGVWR